MSLHGGSLGELWKVRNSAAQTLALCDEQMRVAIRAATHEDLIAILDTFSPARSSGPEWTRTFEPLVERLWAWRDDTTMAALADAYRKRGPAWAAVANALSGEQGTVVRQRLQQPAWARLPVFAVT